MNLIKKRSNKILLVKKVWGFRGEKVRNCYECEWKSEKLLAFDIFNYAPMMNIKFEVEAASRYGSGTTKMMSLLAAPAPQHFF
jgi:hypothetical protein